MKHQIRIRNLGDALEGFRETWKAVEQGKKIKPQSGTSFTSLEAARKILTPKRLELLRVIRRERPKSLYGLARFLGRDLKNVNEDVQVLSTNGLLSLTKTRGSSGRTVTVPQVKFREIEVRIAV